jgi:transposase-like protein
VIEYTSERRCIFMASKGQKFNKYSDEIRSEILNKYISGITSARFEKEFNVSQRTIRNWKKILYSSRNVSRSWSKMREN